MTYVAGAVDYPSGPQKIDRAGLHALAIVGNARLTALLVISIKSYGAGVDALRSADRLAAYFLAYHEDCCPPSNANGEPPATATLSRYCLATLAVNPSSLDRFVAQCIGSYAPLPNDVHPDPFPSTDI